MTSRPSIARLTGLGLAIATGALLLPAAAGAHAQSDVLQALTQEQAQTAHIYKVHFPDLRMARKAEITFHAQLMESFLDQGYLIIELSPSDKKRIEALGFTTEPATEWIRQRNERLERLKAYGGKPLLGRAAAQAGAGTESIPKFPCYETVEETFAAMDGFTTTYPTLARVVDIGDSWKKTQADGGYDLRVLKLTNTAIAGNKPKLFLNSAIHAREYTTAPLVLAFARQLLEGYGTDADATWILDHHEIHMLLQTNPDGRKQAEGGASWRKNANDAFCPGGVRLGGLRSTGADLNRNFSYSWNSTDGQGSSSAKCDQDYRGPGASSEPETGFIEAYIRSLWPDRRGPGLDDAAPADTSGIHIDIHSYSGLVLWPWGVRDAPAPNGTALQALGRRFAWFNGYTPEQSIGLYPTDGTSDGPSYGELGVAAYTFELGKAFFESCTAYESTVKPGNLPALMYAAKMVRTPYQTAGGPDVTSVTLTDNAATTGVPKGTRVTLTASATDLRFNNSQGVEPTQNIAAVEIYVDTPPWQSGARALPLPADDGAFNTPTETASRRFGTAKLSKGKHIVYVRARDASNTWGPITATFLVIN